jgi:hypothetical protein
MKMQHEDVYEIFSIQVQVDFVDREDFLHVKYFEVKRHLSSAFT